MIERYDVAIVGAGPAGIAAACNAAANKLSHVLFEKREIGNTIYDYQLRKYVMAEPGKLPLRGQLPFEAGSREEILEKWTATVGEMGVNVKRGEVSAIKKTADGFELSVGDARYLVKQVVLSIGVQGTPRRLGVPGDDLPHVAYTLADPDAFNDMDILVVGAGDAAIENALALADRNRVSLLNRTAEFPRAKDANVAKIMEAIGQQRVQLFANSSVARVEPQRVFITTPQGEVEVPCGHIIARLGCILPRKFLEGIGIQFPNSDPESVPVVDRRYESNVKGLYILGALIGYPLIKQAINQGFEVIEHILGREVEPADQVLVEERLQVLPGNVNETLAMIRRSLPLFRELSDPQFRELIIESTVHVKKPGEVIFERNDYTDTFFSVVNGGVAIEVGAKQEIAIGQGGFFGEMGLLSGRRRSATVRSSGASIVLETPRKQMLKIVASVTNVRDTLDRIFMVRAMQTTVFPDAEPALVAALAERAQMKRFKKGEVLFAEGQPGDLAYVIRKGSVKVSRRNSRGIDVAQTYIAAGNLIGEMALISDKPRSATVVAVVPVEAIALTKQDFLELLSKSPRTRERVGRIASEREIENLIDSRSEYGAKLLEFMMSEGVTDADNFLMIDSDLCIACDNCERACAETHGGCSRLDRKGGKTFANVQIPISCRHCENPLCMLDCPPDALTRLANGEVVIRDSCIGCGNCVRNCPYGVIQLVHDHEPEGFSLQMLIGWLKPSAAAQKESGAAQAAKCDMCSGRPGGPACVRSCPTGAALRVNPSQMLTLINSKQRMAS